MIYEIINKISENDFKNHSYEILDQFFAELFIEDN